MGNKKVEFTFGINSSNFNKNITSMNNQMKILRNEMQQASNDIVKSGSNLTTLANKYKSIENALEGAKNKVKLYEDQIKKTNDTLEKNKKKLAELGEQKEKTNKLYDEAVEQYGKESNKAQTLKEALDKLNNQYKEQENRVASNERSIQKYTVQMSNAQTEVSKLEAELSNCNEEIQTQSNTFIQASEKLEATSEKFKSFGGKVDEVSTKILGISTAVLGAVSTLGMMNASFETGIAKVNTLVSDSGDSLNRYKENVLELSNDTGMAVGDLTDALYNAISAGVDYGNSVEFINEINKVAVGGFTDIGSASNLMTQIMNIYGKSVEDVGDVSDKLFLVQKNGVTTVGELASSMGEAMTMGSSYNVSLENILSSYASLTKQGRTASTAQTQLKSMIQELGDTASNVGTILQEKTGKSFTALMQDGKSLYDVLDIIKSSCDGNEDAFNNLWSSTEAGLSAMSLLSNEGEFFNQTLSDMANSAGLTDEAYNIMADTTEHKLKKAINNLKNSFVTLGEGATPLIEKLSEAITKVAEVLSEMDSETVETVANVALLGAGIGIAGKAIGGLSTGIGTVLGGLSKLAGLLATTGTATAGTATGIAGATTALAGLSSVALPISAVLGTVALGFYAVHESNDVLKGSILDTTDNMSLMEKGMASLMGVQKYSKEELQDMGLVYKDFNENISEEFQSKVKESEESLRDFSLYLKEINFDGVLDENESNKFNEKVNSIVDSAISTIESKKGETNTALQELFINDGVISETEQKTLDFLNKNYDTNITETNKLKDDIYAIKETALNEQRSLNDEEIKLVEEKLAEIKRIELEAIGSNEEEISYAKNEFNARMATIDLQSATDLLTEKAKIRDEESVQIKASYDTQIEMLKGKLNNANEEERVALEESIRNLEADRDSKIQIQENLWDEYLAILLEKNPEIASEINRFNGELLLEEDKKAQATLEKMDEMYAGLGDITKDGMYKIYNTTTKSWDDIQIDVDEATGEIVGMYNFMNNESGGYTKKIADDNAKLGQSYKWTEGEIKKSMNEMAGSTVDAKGRIVTASGEIQGSLRDIKTNADGTRTGILNLNGTPIEVKVNKDGTINSLNEISNKISNIPTYKQVVVGVQYSESGKPSWNGSTKYAIGTPSKPENGIALVNEKGWELIDTKGNDIAYSLGRALEGELAYVPEGARIQTNLSSTQQMKQEINKEVNKRINDSLSADIEWMTKSIVRAIKDNGGADVDITNNFDITNNEKVDGEILVKDINKIMASELRRFGRIK